MILRRWLNSPAGLAFHPRTWWFSLLHWSCRGRVISGPFAGMRYVANSVGSTYTPKLLGTYEKELHDCIGTLTQRTWERIIDVGAAEGYYAMGLAILTSRPVVAFEQEEAGRSLLAKMATLNEMETHLEIRGACDPDNFSEALRESPECLVVMDVEGYETVLLSDLTSSLLARTTILVEIHESPEREVTHSLQARFEPTHRWTEFQSTERKRADFTGPNWIARLAFQPAWIISAMDESRGRPMTWLLFEPIPVR